MGNKKEMPKKGVGYAAYKNEFQAIKDRKVFPGAYIYQGGEEIPETHHNPQKKETHESFIARIAEPDVCQNV
jgi:hypothetical protein